MQAIKQAIAELNQRRDLITKAIDSLIKLESELVTLPSQPAPRVEPQHKPATKAKKHKSEKRVATTKPTATPPASVLNAPLIKPTTVGGAMKRLISKLGKFTRQQLKDALLADADWAKLMEASPTAFAGNLIYWSDKTGKLERHGEGDSETFTVADKSFFEK